MIVVETQALVLMQLLILVLESPSLESQCGREQQYDLYAFPSLQSSHDAFVILEGLDGRWDL